MGGGGSRANTPKVGDTRTVNGVQQVYGPTGKGGTGWHNVQQNPNAPTIPANTTGGGTAGSGGNVTPNQVKTGVNKDQFGNTLAPLTTDWEGNKILDPVARAAQADVFDTEADAARSRGWAAASMHKGYRSSYLMGPRGLEGGSPAWMNEAIDWQAMIDGRTVQGTAPVAPHIIQIDYGSLGNNGKGKGADAAPAPLPDSTPVSIQPDANPIAAAGSTKFGDLGKWYRLQ